MRRFVTFVLPLLVLACAGREPMPAGWIRVGPGQYWPAVTAAGRELEKVPALLRSGDRPGAQNALHTAADIVAGEANRLNPDEAGVLRDEIARWKQELDPTGLEGLGSIRATRAARALLFIEARYFPPEAKQAEELSRKIDSHFTEARALVGRRKLSAAARELQKTAGLIRYATASDANARLERVIQDLQLAAATYLDEGWIATKELARLEGRAHTSLARFYLNRARQSEDPDAFGAICLSHLEHAGQGKFQEFTKRRGSPGERVAPDSLENLVHLLEEHYF